jgi:hypothetical protein
LPRAFHKEQENHHADREACRTVSTCLRRLLARGAVRLVQKGTAHIQAVYTRS